MIAQVISSLTVSLRFEGALQIDVIHEFQVGLIPYPRIHFLLCSYAPIVGAAHVDRERLTVEELTSAAFDPSSMMAKCDPRNGTPLQYVATVWHQACRSSSIWSDLPGLHLQASTRPCT